MKFKRKKAYTLVELLVVIAILSIAFSVVYVGGSSGDGAKLSSAERILSGLVKSARAQAILKNADVRLIIYNDVNSEVDKYRRFIGIIYDNDPGSARSWVAATKGTYLPKGIYFDASLSNTKSGSNWSESSKQMNINYPRLTESNGTSGASYLYYEFNNNGTSSNTNAYLVFRAGQFIPGSGLTFPAEKGNLKSGLIIRRSGSATLVDDPGNI